VSHAEGDTTIASGQYSHAEGQITIASGDWSHAEGKGSIASGSASHAEGQSKSIGSSSHSQGQNTISSGNYSHSGGKGFSNSSNVVASGRTSFVHFELTNPFGDYGAYGDYSVILGGTNHNVLSGSTSSSILGGSNNTISGFTDAMIVGSNLTAEISYNKIPIIPAVRNYIAQKTIPGATARNWSSCSAGVAFGAGIDEQEATLLLPDPQTNGGLLIAVAPEALEEVQAVLKELGIQYIHPIGTCTAAKEKRIYITKDE
jgi:hypothetical protein